MFGRDNVANTFDNLGNVFGGMEDHMLAVVKNILYQNQSTKISF